MTPYKWQLLVMLMILPHPLVWIGMWLVTSWKITKWWEEKLYKYHYHKNQFQ